MTQENRNNYLNAPGSSGNELKYQPGFMPKYEDDSLKNLLKGYAG